MVVREEIDALRVMGLDPVEFTLAPKYLAASVTLPCLTVLSTLCGDLRRVPVPGLQHGHESSHLLPGGGSSDTPARRRLHAGQERVVRHHHCPRRLPGRPASPRRSGSSRAFHHGRCCEIDVPGDLRGPGGHGDLLFHGLELDQMTNPDAAKAGDAVISIRDVSMSLAISMQ